MFQDKCLCPVTLGAAARMGFREGRSFNPDEFTVAGLKGR